MQEPYPVIAALDPSPNEPDPAGWVINAYERLGGIVAGCKLGLPLILRLGIDKTGLVTERLRKAGCNIVVADMKIADVPHVSAYIAKLVDRAGFDVVIAHWLIGNDGLKAVADEFEGGVWVVTSLSSGAPAGAVDPLVPLAVRVAEEAGAEGLVAPATRPGIISLIRRIGWRGIVASPGVGVQGAPACSGLRAGADYEIVGRSLVQSADPLEWVKAHYSGCKGRAP